MDIPAYFERLLRLVRKGGGPVVIAGEGGEEPLVVLTLSAYEALSDQGSGSQNLSPRERVYEDEDFDPQVVERQVEEVAPPRPPRPLGGMAAMRPRQSLNATREVAEPKGEIRQKPQENTQSRRPILRRPTERNEGGEERFYLESV
ncbi:hypothetical protein KBC55_00470 [Patescibacteria group bacterium]|nr:hypothetical protein [Patescibacteria group bacterium]